MHVEILARNVPLTPLLRDLVERRVRFALARFANRVQEVRVRLDDLNGPRGGLDMRCHMTARLRTGGQIDAELTDLQIEPAICRCAERLARRVRDAGATRIVLRRRRRAKPPVPAPAE